MTREELDACVERLREAADECPPAAMFVLIVYDIGDDGEAQLAMRTNDSPENVIAVLTETARAAREHMPGAQ